MKDKIKYGSDVLEKLWELVEEARQSYIDHDGRFPGEKIRKIGRYCDKVAGKRGKSSVQVADETHHWIVGDGKRYWIGRDIHSRAHYFVSGTAAGAYRCGCPGAAQAMLDSEEVKTLIRTLVKPGKFGVYLINDKVEVSPCRS